MIIFRGVFLNIFVVFAIVSNILVMSGFMGLLGLFFGWGWGLWLKKDGRVKRMVFRFGVVYGLGFVKVGVLGVGFW